uniref:Uncharacterized protein n=1 Tax=Molossus molossus TaxID=27622 RepID=A0A7J8E2X3_MOLMO|nr:hypothetical protein HJG59_008974 [Molossus molossus]
MPRPFRSPGEDRWHVAPVPPAAAPPPLPGLLPRLPVPPRTTSGVLHAGPSVLAPRACPCPQGARRTPSGTLVGLSKTAPGPANLFRECRCPGGRRGQDGGEGPAALPAWPHLARSFSLTKATRVSTCRGPLPFTV